ncbi:kinetochore-associated Ndc80 complex subunit NUF2 PWA37_004263 [Arxiozyma heterogenica]|uniref:kinetochore-associated Ndc80 complex subunit NUF2 n=1 Tax=Arxiozyma heterogenica TaxID=278026 RepID=UPI002EFD94D0
MSMDEFPLLDVPELVSCLQECDFSAATLETITKPTSPSIIKLYQQIIDLFANINTENYSIQPNQDMTETLDTSNTIPIAILNLTCHKFFKVIGISDFNMMDLCKPDFQRTRRLLSAVVNYARFREERIFDYKESIQQMSDLSDVLESKFDSFNLLRQQNNEIRAELGHLNNDLNYESRNIEDDEEYNTEKLDNMSNDLEVQLKSLTKQQESLSLEYESYKLTKNDLLTELEKCGFQLIELESKRDKLKKISDTDVVILDENIKQLQETLSANKDKLQTLITKKDNLEITLKTLERIISELYDLTNVISSDLKVSYGREISIMNTKKTLIEKKITLENLLKTSLSSQLKLAKEQLSRQEIIHSNLKKDMASKIQENEEKINDLNNIYSNEIMKRLMETDKHITNDIIEKEVKSIELEIHSKKQQFSNELDELEEEYILLINHVKDYMSTVLSNLD